MTPPATDRGLSEADREAVARIISPSAFSTQRGARGKPDMLRADRASNRDRALAKADDVLALLAAARREGEGGIASRDHASDTGVALDWRPLADLPDLSYDTRVLVDREDWDSPSTFEAYELKPEALALWRDPPTHFVLLDSFTRAPPSSAKQVLASDPGMQNQ